MIVVVGIAIDDENGIDEVIRGGISALPEWVKNNDWITHG